MAADLTGPLPTPRQNRANPYPAAATEERSTSSDFCPSCWGQRRILTPYGWGICGACLGTGETMRPTTTKERQA